MEAFLASFANEDYEAMASSLIEMGATEKDVDVKAFARDLEKIFSSIQVLMFHIQWITKLQHRNVLFVYYILLK